MKSYKPVLRKTFFIAFILQVFLSSQLAFLVFAVVGMVWDNFSFPLLFLNKFFIIFTQTVILKHYFTLVTWVISRANLTSAFVTTGSGTNFRGQISSLAYT